MDPEKLRLIVEEAVRNATTFHWWSYLVVVIIVGLGAFLASYLGQKGQNLATKEDTTEITRKVEEVRSEFTTHMEKILQQNRVILEGHKALNQLRLAAIDRRLQAHQEAYTLWRELSFYSTNRKAIGSIIIKCQNWWDNNCLYLEPKVRKAFYLAYTAANLRPDLLAAGQELNATERDKMSEEIKGNFDTIMKPGEIIPEAVGFISLEDIDKGITVKEG